MTPPEALPDRRTRAQRWSLVPSSNCAPRPWTGPRSWPRTSPNTTTQRDQRLRPLGLRRDGADRMLMAPPPGSSARAGGRHFVQFAVGPLTRMAHPPGLRKCWHGESATTTSPSRSSQHAQQLRSRGSEEHEGHDAHDWADGVGQVDRDQPAGRAPSTADSGPFRLRSFVTRGWSVDHWSSPLVVWPSVPPFTLDWTSVASTATGPGRAGVAAEAARSRRRGRVRHTFVAPVMKSSIADTSQGLAICQKVCGQADL